MKKILRKIILFLIIAIATGIVLYFSLKDNYTVIIDTILHINKIWLGIAFLLFFTYYFLKSYVTRNFAAEFNSDYSLKDAFRMTTETSFFHAVTPFATGGQPYEIYSLMKHNINIIDATNVSIESFIVYQIALVFLGAVSIICNHFFHILNSNLLKNFLTLGFLINFLVIVVLFWITLSKKTEKNIIYKIIDVLAKMKIVKNKEENKEKLKKYLVKFNNGSKLLLKDKKRFISMTIVELFSLTSLYLVPLALFCGIGFYEISGLTCILTMSYVMLIGSFVPIPGGTGGLEYGFVAFFGNFIKGAKLNAIMLLWRFITYYFAMILGAIVLNIKGGKKNESRNIY